MFKSAKNVSYFQSIFKELVIDIVGKDLDPRSIEFKEHAGRIAAAKKSAKAKAQALKRGQKSAKQ